jgi:hypothetical protein
MDPNQPASSWNAEQRAEATAIASTFAANASELANLGVQAKNPVVNDFASMASKYQEAYAQAIPSYMPEDNYLNSVAATLVLAVEEACAATQD